jgi:hypothetical protein
MYLIMINALCNGCACSAVNRLEKETGKRTFPQRRFRSPMKGFDSYDFWPYNVPLLNPALAKQLVRSGVSERVGKR